MIRTGTAKLSLTMRNRLSSMATVRARTRLRVR